MSDWYLLAETSPRGAAENMAVDQHLLERVESGEIDRPVLRLYGWKRPTVSLGYHQTINKAIDQVALERHNLALVRRWTGGRAVLHDFDEITYAVIAPARAPFNEKVSNNYCLIGKALERFTDLGQLAGRMQKTAESIETIRAMKHAPCFASLSTAEIERGGRKLIGSAQKIGRGAFLQHGSIPLLHRAKVLEEVTGTVLDMSRFMTSLNEHYAEAGLPMPQRTDLYAKLQQAFESQLQANFQPLPRFKSEHTASIETIVSQRFGDAAWTHRK